MSCLVGGVNWSKATDVDHSINTATMTYQLRHQKVMSDVIVGVFLLSIMSDLPTHLVDARRQIFLPRGMLGRVACPVDANPPVTLTVWTKDERVIDETRTTRFKIQADGTLLIKPVAPSDAGRYACTPYSSLGAGQTSPSIEIVVRGLINLSFS